MVKMVKPRKKLFQLPVFRFVIGEPITRGLSPEGLDFFLVECPDLLDEQGILLRLVDDKPRVPAGGHVYGQSFVHEGLVRDEPFIQQIMGQVKPGEDHWLEFVVNTRFDPEEAEIVGRVKKAEIVTTG